MPKTDVTSDQGQAAEYVGGSEMEAGGACSHVCAGDLDHIAGSSDGDAKVPGVHSGCPSPSKVGSVPMQSDGTLSSEGASFTIADVVHGADPVLFERSRRYFGSASDHRVAFDDVAGNLQNELDQPPWSLYQKGPCWILLRLASW